MNFLAALKFLTIMRLPWPKAMPRELGWSTVYFPVVGVIIGLILAGLNWLLGLVLPSAIVRVLLIICLVMLTGALHLDGFVDTCDGIAGLKTPKERWEVMHDSRVGAFGVIGACCLLLVKYISLNSVPEPLMTMTLVLMPVISRWVMVYAIFAYPYARPSGLGKAFKPGTDWQRFTLTTVITLMVATGLAWWAGVAYFFVAGLVIMFVIWVIIMVMATYMKHKFAGLTGDTYGAINEVSEVFVLIFICLLTHKQWLGLA